MPKKPLPSVIRTGLSSAIDKIFEKLRYRLLGDWYEPKVNIQKDISTDKILSLPGLYTNSFITENNNNRPSLSTLEGLSKVADSHILSARESLKAQLLHELETKWKTGQLEDLEEAMTAILDKSRGKVKLILETELQRAASIGAADGLISRLSDEGIDDPVLFMRIRDDNACKNCKQIYMLPDGVTPRLYKLSELSFGYFKRDNPQPTISPLHPNCLVGHKHRIYTDKGWRFVTDISIGDKVLTHTGQFQKVVNTLNWVNKLYQGPYHRFFADRRAYEINVTPEHEIYDGERWHRADKYQASNLGVAAFNCITCSKDITAYRTRFFCDAVCREKFFKNMPKYIDRFANRDIFIKQIPYSNERLFSSKEDTNTMPAFLHDIEVDVDHSFVVNGIVSKNCRCSVSSMPSGSSFDSKGNIVYVGPNYDALAEQRKLHKSLDKVDFEHICEYEDRGIKI